MRRPARLPWPAVYILLALMFGLLPALALADASADRPPNFVIFIADDQGEGDMGCYGNRAIRTPNMDRLAAEGMRFTDTFLTISSCKA